MELVVSAVIMAIAVAAIVAVVRTSTGMQVTDYDRRQARAIIMNMFETRFPYNHAPFGEYEFNSGTSLINDAGALILTPNPWQDSTVVINTVGTTPLLGDMRVRVVPEVIGGVPTHRVDISITWPRAPVPAGVTQETLTLSKRLVDVSWP